MEGEETGGGEKERRNSCRRTYGWKPETAKRANCGYILVPVLFLGVVW